MSQQHRGESDIRPKVGGRGGQIREERVPTFRRQMLARLGKLGRGSRNKGKVGPQKARAGSPLTRRCVIKARYVKMDARGLKAARLHLGYIERDGVERDGSQGKLFDAAGVVEREQFAIAVEGERRQFRLIVSPEDGHDLDLKDFTRKLMTQVEADLGVRLRWAAVGHHDTDNPHVHVVVRGVDSNGKELRIPSAYLAHGMRERAREIASRELGPRSEIEIVRQRQREVTQQHDGRRNYHVTGMRSRLAYVLRNRSSAHPERHDK